MTRINRLNSVALTKLPDGWHSDGNNLYLRVLNGERYWLFRMVKDGKRVTKYGVSKKAVLLRKSQIVNHTASPKAANADSFRFLVDNNGNKTVLAYKNIKGHQYYSVGKNAYVRVANVSYVDNKPLYAAFQTVTLGKHNKDTKVPVYDSEGKATKKVLTAGDKVEVDRTKTVKSGKKTLILYGVKGQKDSYLDINDIASLPDLAVLLEK